MKNAISEPRDIKLYLTAAGATGTAAVAAPADAFKAAVSYIEKNEGAFAKGGATLIPDLTAKAIILTGTLPYQVHVFTATTVMATGVYTLVYVETVPSTEDVS